jgi:hypothetical protein
VDETTNKEFKRIIIRISMNSKEMWINTWINSTRIWINSSMK